MDRTIFSKITRVSLFFLPAIILTGILCAQGDSAQKSQEGIIAPSVEYTAESLKDPFLEFGKKQEPDVVEKTQVQVKPLPALAIQGIVWGGPMPQAIINGKVFKVGDTIAEAKITGIDKDGVELFYAGRSYSISSPASGSQTTGR